MIGLKGIGPGSDLRSSGNGDISKITKLIPEEASEENKLADKKYVDEAAAPKYKKVDELPETGEVHTIYIVPDPDDPEKSLQYMYIDGEWINLGAGSTLYKAGDGIKIEESKISIDPEVVATVEELTKNEKVTAAALNDLEENKLDKADLDDCIKNNEEVEGELNISATKDIFLNSNNSESENTGAYVQIDGNSGEESVLLTATDGKTKAASIEIEGNSVKQVSVIAENGMTINGSKVATVDNVVLNGTNQSTVNIYSENNINIASNSDCNVSITTGWGGDQPGKIVVDSESRESIQLITNTEYGRIATYNGNEIATVEDIKEVKTIIEDDEKVTAAALNDLKDRIDNIPIETVKLADATEENDGPADAYDVAQHLEEIEYVTAAALNDLEDRKLDDTDLEDYIKKSETEGLIKNDGTVDTTTYVVNGENEEDVNILVNGTTSFEFFNKTSRTYTYTGESVYGGDGTYYYLVSSIESDTNNATKIAPDTVATGFAQLYRVVDDGSSVSVTTGSLGSITSVTTISNSLSLDSNGAFYNGSEIATVDDIPDTSNFVINGDNGSIDVDILVDNSSINLESKNETDKVLSFTFASSATGSKDYHYVTEDYQCPDESDAYQPATFTKNEITYYLIDAAVSGGKYIYTTTPESELAEGDNLQTYLYYIKSGVESTITTLPSSFGGLVSTVERETISNEISITEDGAFYNGKEIVTEDAVEELKEIIEDNEKVTAAALNDLQDQINNISTETVKLEDATEENDGPADAYDVAQHLEEIEYVTAQALTSLDESKMDKQDIDDAVREVLDDESSESRKTIEEIVETALNDLWENY